MHTLNLNDTPGAPLRLLCLGAHSDDIEIGCGGLILQLLSQRRRVDVDWVVFSARDQREREARKSAGLFLRGARRSRVIVKAFRDGFFPHEFPEIKGVFEELKSDTSPDVILTHYRDDRHQDHRTLSDLTWNTFRDHCILEYEIPKYDGDMGAPNLFVPLRANVAGRKIKHLEAVFGTQRGKHWFDADTFRGLMRLRGMECRAKDRYAEAFYARKVVVGI
jgi:LmbE family N-acetylglucosaminyl deacetylase